MIYSSQVIIGGDEMRTTYNGDIIQSENGDFVGFSLGADYCAEHERGIGVMNEAFGIPSDETIFGLEKRTITIVPEGLYYTKGEKKKKMHYALVYKRPWRNSIGEMPSFGLLGDRPLGTAWSNEEFAIVVDRRYKKELELLHNAFLEKDVAIGLGGGGVFSNAGLSICIASRFPKGAAKQLEDGDKAYYQLQQDARNTGIYEFLNDKGKKYFALSPKYFYIGARTILKFFLNPYDQDRYNHGWFTVEELQEWAEEKGPIIKKK